MNRVFSRTILWTLVVLLLPAGVGFADDAASEKGDTPEIILPEGQTIDADEAAYLAAREGLNPDLMEVTGAGHHEESGPLLGGIAVLFNILIVAGLVAYGLGT